MFHHLPSDLFPGQEILTLSLVSTELSLETLEQNKLNSTAKLSFSKLSKSDSSLKNTPSELG